MTYHSSGRQKLKGVMIHMAEGAVLGVVARVLHADPQASVLGVCVLGCLWELFGHWVWNWEASIYGAVGFPTGAAIVLLLWR